MPPHFFGGGERHTLPPSEGHQQDAQKKPSSSPSSPHEPDLDHCLDNPYDPRCLVGVRALDDTDGLEGRMKRLLDGPKPPTPPPQQSMGGNQQQPVIVGRGRHSWNAGATDDTDNLSDPSLLRIEGPRSSSVHAKFLGFIGSDSRNTIGGQGIGGIWEAVIVSLIFGALTSWMLWAKFKAKLRKSSAKSQDEKKEVLITPTVVDGNRVEVADVQVKPAVDSSNLEKDKEPTTPKASSSPLPSVDDAPTPTVRKEPPPSIPIPTTPGTPSLETSTPGLDTPTPGLGDEGDDLSDGEGVEAGAAAPGKRRNRRGRRGKKKKPGLANGAANGDGLEREDGENGEGEVPKEENKPPSLVLTTTSPKPPVVQQPSLVVSDTVLGKFTCDSSEQIAHIYHRVRLSRHCRIPRLPPRPSSGR